MVTTDWVKEKSDLSLLDEEFLSALTEQKEREIYARIASLDINENPIEYIEGKVTGGSINIDGDSAVRRTCSLTMISEDIDINEYYWGIRTKFKLEIGLKNNLGSHWANNALYPDIVWFPQGTFIVAGFNTSLSTTNCTISITGKDKMCMLNGELGGQLFASIDFGQDEYQMTVMTKVDTTSVASSDFLMAKEYYIEAITFPEEISTSNIDYALIEDSTGNYYKQENIFTTTGVGKKYKLYQLVKNPNDLFIQQSYDPNATVQYYYEKNTNYYLLNNTKATKGENQDYILKDIYKKDYIYTIKKIPLETIIRESVHAYAKEPYHNIIINDLQNYGLEQLTYRGDKDLYVLRDVVSGHFTQMAFKKENDPITQAISTWENTNSMTFQYDSLVSEFTSETGSQIELSSNYYTVARIKYGDDLGYRVTDLTYTGDLISSIGETLTSILDKIKQMLGDFEYFYDLDGRFVFQRKQTYVNTAWSQFVNNQDETYVTYYNDKKRFSFSFEGNRLVTAVNNSPVLTNLKNDFSVWGKRKSISGEDIPIHARYAIDKKPVLYKAFNGITYAVDQKYIYQILDIPTFDESSALAEIRAFTLDYSLPSFLQSPRKKEDGSWTAGWWDIRDWAAYYELLTGEYPNKTMKFYSSNDESGCVSVHTLGPDFNHYSPSSSVWLLEITPTGYVNLGHGLGVFSSGSRNCTCYESEIVNNQLVTTATETKKVFYSPYSGCADTHTYPYFLQQIEKYGYQGVYFYNPQFPEISYEELIDNRIETAYQQWLENNSIKIVDWREIIYQMAKDYFAGQGCSEKEPLYIKNENNEFEALTNPDYFLSEVASRNQYYYPTGYTGYEQYYTDIEGFWRQLYNPDYEPQLIYSPGKYVSDKEIIEDSIYYKRIQRWEEAKITDVNIDYYIAPSVKENILQQVSQEDQDIITTKLNKYTAAITSNIADRLYWNIAIFENPETLNFWIEFFEDGDELQQFAVPQVGSRSKVVNDDKVTAIIFKEIPDIILYDRFDGNNNIEDLRKKLDAETGYTWVYLPKGFSQYLTISYRSVSAKNKIDELLYQYAYCIENISITALPIYHLQPNTRIYVRDEKTQINGEYIVSKLTIPLTYNGTMSITAVKAPERFY